MRCYSRLPLLAAALGLLLLAGPSAGRKLLDTADPDVPVCSINRPGYHWSEVADPTQTCAVGTPNNLNAKSNPLKLHNWADAFGAKPQIDSLYCNTCWLYVNHVQNPTTAHGDRLTHDFVETAESGGEKLMLPLTPCRGVEDVYGTVATGADCKGEHIWANGFASLKHDKTEGTHGLGVNPTNRRSQHQLHMHMSEVRHGLWDVLKKVPSNKQWVDLDCSAKSKSLGQCKGLASSASPVKARVIDGDDVTKVSPFELAYGPNAPLSTGSATASNTVWLFFLPGPSPKFVVVVAEDRPAECAFNCKTCLDSKHCPE